MTSPIPFLISYIPPLSLAALAGGSILVSRHSDKPRFWRILATVFSVLVFILLCAIFYRFTIDDTFISLRYARNAAQGHGIVYSIGPQNPVEGYTNFLWIILESPLFLFHLSDTAIVHAVKLLGIIFGIGVVLFTQRLGSQIGTSPSTGVSAALLTSTIPFLAFWSIGGLETSMFTFFALAAISALVAEHEAQKTHIWSYVFLLLLALTRPEGLFFALAVTPAMGLLKAVDRTHTGSTLTRIRSLIPGFALFAVLYGAYFTWRWQYYGYLLPNTFYAKSGSISFGQIVHRIQEMSELLRYMVPLAILALLAQPFRLRHKAQARVIVSFAFLVLFAFGFASKREWMSGFRYELPAIPFLVALSAVSLCAFDGNTKENRRNIPWNAQTLLLLLFVAALQLLPTHDFRAKKRYTDDLTRCHIALGKWLREFAPSDSSYASWDMGAVPYFSHLPTIVEIHTEGLLDVHTTHVGYDIDRFLSLRPSFIVLPKRPADSARQLGGIMGFYSHVVFKEQYQHLFTMALRPDYFLEVHKRADIPLTAEALSEGERIAAESRAKAW